MRVGVDTGGTFTDVIATDDGRVFTHKLLSTPDDPARAVLEGIDVVLERAGRARAQLTGVVHGSTVATNALLERRGARAVLVTTAGFEDVLEIGRQNRPALHALRVEREAAVIEAADRFGVRERIGADGEVVTPLDDEEIERVVEAVRAAAPESIAVVLLHSYLRTEHERALADALEAALGVPVTVSHELLPEYREYERTSTCAVNAYVAPKMSGYLHRLEQALGRELRIMQSNGGSIAASRAGRDAVHTILSGPAGGVVGARAASAEPRLISFDMGGTSTDVCLIDGEATVRSDAIVAGHPIRVPIVDIHTVGAGGGSIAWRDAGGALRVGPRSAGARPGPACYARGGKSPTVTDAHLVLGRLVPERFLGGAFRLDPTAASAAVRGLADELDLSTDECAHGILRITDAIVARAIRRISLERGHDPRRFSLMSFGGAGGLHACALAEELAIPRVLVPAHPGLLSAYGMLAARAEREVSRTVLLDCDPQTGPADPDSLESAYRALEGPLRASLEAEGVEVTLVQRTAELRYRGQSYEMRVDHDRDPTSTLRAFHAAHEHAFGYRMDRSVQWVAVRVRAAGPTPEAPRFAPPTGSPRTVREAVVERATLPPGSTLIGPTCIVELSATTWLPDGWQGRVETGGTLTLTLTRGPQ